MRSALPAAAGLFGPDPVETPPTAGLYVEVVFDRPLDHPYTYAVPDNLRDTVAVGKRVMAPFGRGDRATVGYCVGIRSDDPPRTVKAITGVLDAEALLSPDLLRLTRWLADYYLCGWGQVLQAILPAGVRDQAGVRKAIMIAPVTDLPDPLPRLTTKQTQVLEYLRQRAEPVERRELAHQTNAGPAVIDALVAKGFARKSVARVERDLASEGREAPGMASQRQGDGTPRAPEATPIQLNSDQLRAWAPVEQAVRAGGFQAFLLYGVTGSGKTEIYLRAIEEVVRQGKEAIVLVPEISLTPQTIERFRGRCGQVAVLHSHLGDADRGVHWRRVASGQVQVVVGARSAVFAPTRKLGLIVVDEEHETTFKQENTPRYHARDVAVMRARLENVPILLGSATPSLESWHNAAEGRYTLLSLPQRVADRPMPPVELIDLRHERPRGPFSAVGPTLERAMRQALATGGQVILLLNRRGFSTHVHCPECGHVLTCQHCDLALTYHKGRNALMCHYCGYETTPVQRCPQCQKETVRYMGLGTEKLLAEIAQKFPDRVVQRMDSDTMDRPGSHARALDAFREGRTHILLGTQMIAKGLDFPNVTLVGVINADVGLHLPDFRAAERTFQLLSQVAGRAGRGPRGGRVQIQTYSPEHPCIALAAKHDYETFVARELDQRKLHQYPPYQRLVRIIIRSLEQEAAGQFADRLAGAFRAALATEAKRSDSPASLRLLGPAECPVFRLNGYYRFHFQLQSPSAAQMHRVLRDVLAVVRPPAGVDFQIDVDPFNML